MNPSWHDIFLITGTLITLLVGILTAIIGAYAKGLGSRISSLEGRHSKLNNLVLSQYHNKDEIRDLLGEIKESVHSLHNRFDMLLQSQAQKE